MISSILRQAADDENEAIGIQRRRFVDRPLVVVDCSRPTLGACRGKHAAAAKPGHLELVVGDDASSLRKPDLVHLIAPGRNRDDILLQAGFDRTAHVILLAHRRR